MIQVKKDIEGELRVSFPYEPELVEKIKRIYGRKWVAEEKYWTVPDTEDIIKNFSLYLG